MMKILAAGAMSLAFSAAAMAEGPAGQVYEVSAGEGTATVNFASDGSYSIAYSEGGSSGTWTYSDGQLCVTDSEAGEQVCNEWSNLGVGESIVTAVWSGEGVEQTITRVE